MIGAISSFWNGILEWSIVQVTLACALCVDAASISLALGMARAGRIKAFVFAGMTGVFHAWFPYLSANAGGWGAILVGWYAPLASGMLFALLGIQMIYDTIKNSKKSGEEVFSGGIPQIIVIAMLVSADALTAGFSIGLVRTLSLMEALGFGILAFISSLIGWVFGRYVAKGKWEWRWSGMAGGLVLIAFGIHLLLEWG